MSVSIPPLTLSESFEQMSDMFRYFKMNSLRTKTWVSTGSVSANPFYAVFFVPQGITNAISSMNQIDSLHASVGVAISNTAGAQQPTILNIPGSALAPPGGPWFMTSFDATDGAFDQAGALTIQMNDTTHDGFFVFELDFNVTFKERLDPSMLALAMKSRVEEVVAERLNSACFPVVVQGKTTVRLNPADSANKYTVQGK